MIRFQIKGLDKLARALGEYPKLSARETQDAINKSLLTIERKAKIKTPVDTGRLRGGYRLSFGLLKGTIFNPVKYAVRQHENLGFRHTTGEAKFLEKGALESLGAINGFFALALEKVLKKIEFLKLIVINK